MPAGLHLLYQKLLPHNQKFLSRIPWFIRKLNISYFVTSIQKFSYVKSEGDNDSLSLRCSGEKKKKNKKM